MVLHVHTLAKPVGKHGCGLQLPLNCYRAKVLVSSVEVTFPQVFYRQSRLSMWAEHLQKCVFSSLAFDCICTIMCWGVVSGAENKAILWHKGEKTYLPVALHWVCHLNKIQASTVRSREVLGQWKNEFRAKLLEEWREAESTDLHMIISIVS